MAGFPGLRRATGAVLGMVALAPIAALALAAFLDRGPSGGARLTLFPVALAALDDHVWDCLWNSLAVAVAVTLASRFVGVALARIVVRWRFWGRSFLVALACAGAVVPPAFGAIGLRSIEPWNAWLIWFWVALVASAPLVGLAAGAALSRVNPCWEDAARVEGASRAQIWRRLVWPVVRPEVARALAVVFSLVVIEPGVPFVLGLRRTLGFQIADAALDPAAGQFTRAAVLAVAGVLIACIGHLLIVWSGGPRTLALEGAGVSLARDEAARPARGAVCAILLAVAAMATWLPILALARAVFANGAEALKAVARDPLALRYVINSVIVGIGVLVFDLALARVSASRRNRWDAWFEALPPLAIGVGVLAIPWSLRMLLRDGQALAFVDAFDPDRVPWVALILGVGLTRLPFVKRSVFERRRGLQPALLDAAITLGASRRQAHRLVPGRLLGVSPSLAFLTFALAVSNITPALLLCPTAETRPLGPAVLILIDEPGGGLARASALALLAIALNLFAAQRSCGARRQSAWLDAWLRK